MPKLSKRKRQLKEIYYRKNESEGNSENNTNSALDDGDEDDTESQDEPPAKVAAQPLARSGVNDAPSKSTRSSTQKQANAQGRGTNGNSSNEKAPDVERVWVQCNNCDKWRSLPSTVNPDALPDIWTCDLNIYDPDRMSCDAPEESYYKGDDEQQHVQLKSFLRLWVKKLKTADRAETRMSTPAMTRGRKRKLDVEWIRCCNPQCGKWRAVTRGIETANLLKRLNKNKRFGEGQWFCAMNSWDETTASCGAPQEPLWNCRWNLNNA
jgi:hypothetical protein